MNVPSPKRAIPVPVEKALKAFYSYLLEAKEDLVCQSAVTSVATTDASINKQIQCLDQFKTLGDALTHHLDLDLSEHEQEQKLTEMLQEAHDDIDKNFSSCFTHWVEKLLKKVSNILNSTQYVNLERLTELMEKNEQAGDGMEGKDVVLLLGSAGSGKTSTLHYLAGSCFQEVEVEGKKHYEPADIIHPQVEGMKISCSGGQTGNPVVTRHLQVAELDIEGKPVVICDTPSFGYHESVEEVIANSLSLVRALQKAKTVRPVLVLNHEEMASSDCFVGYPQIVLLLNRLIGESTNIDMSLYNCVFTKYDRQNAAKVEKQLTHFQDDIQNDTEKLSTKHLVLEYLIKHGNDPEERVVKPTTGDPTVFLRNLLKEPSVTTPGMYFKPRINNIAFVTLKRQLKFALLNLRSSLDHDDNSTAIFRMGQLSDLANVLPEAGIYARHGFKAFKEVISKMVEEDIDEEYGADSELSSSSEESEESWTSTESEQWHNLSSRLRKTNSFVPPQPLSPVAEDIDESSKEEENKEDPSEEFSPEEVSGILKSLVDESEDESSNEEEKKEEDNGVELEYKHSKDHSREHSKGRSKSSSPKPPLYQSLSQDSSVFSTKVGRQFHLGIQNECSSISSLSSNSADSSEGHYDSHSEDGSHDSSYGSSMDERSGGGRSDSSSQDAGSESSSEAAEHPASPFSSTSSENGDNISYISEVDNKSNRSTTASTKSTDRLSRRSVKSESCIYQKPQNASKRQPASVCLGNLSQRSMSSHISISSKKPVQEKELPKEEEEYAEDYIALLREMIMDAVEQQDQSVVLQKMHAFCEAVQSRPQEAECHHQFQNCVEYFMRFSVALEEGNYSKCLSSMNKLIKLRAVIPEAEKCSQFGLDAAVRHIVGLRENVVNLTNYVHEIVDPDEFDRVLEVLRTEREKVEQSNRLIEMCMKESNDKGKSQTMLACISYGFKLGRTSR